MSDQSVLYDVPGPRAVRRQRIGTAAALVLIAGLVAVAIQRLASRGQLGSTSLVRILDRLSGLRRIIEQIAKGARLYAEIAERAGAPRKGQ